MRSRRFNPRSANVKAWSYDPKSSLDAINVLTRFVDPDRLDEFVNYFSAELLRAFPHMNAWQQHGLLQASTSPAPVASRRRSL